MDRRHHVGEDLAKGWTLPASDKPAAVMRDILRRTAAAPRPPRKTPLVRRTRRTG